MTSLCSRIHILTLGLELLAIDFFFLTDGADMSADMTAAYFSNVWSDGGRLRGLMDRGQNGQMSARKDGRIDETEWLRIEKPIKDVDRREDGAISRGGG